MNIPELFVSGNMGSSIFVEARLIMRDCPTGQKQVEAERVIMFNRPGLISQAWNASIELIG